MPLAGQNGHLLTSDAVHRPLWQAVASCWASYGYGDHEACKKLNPDYQIDHLADFSKVIA